MTVALVGFGTGCGESAPNVPVHLQVLAPAEGATVPAGDIAVSLLVENFELVEPEQAAHRPVAEPWPLQLVPTAWAHDEDGLPSGYVLLTLDSTELPPVSDTQHTLVDVVAGEHTLRAALRYADGDPLEPDVEVHTTFIAD